MTSRALLVAAALLLPAGQAAPVDFYVDPVNGRADGDGSAERPWRRAQDVIDRGLVASRDWDAMPYDESRRLVAKNAGAPVQAGDTLWLMDGYHGALRIISHYNEGVITIAAMEGHRPRFRSIRIDSSSHWALKGLHVSAEFGAGERPRAMVGLQEHDNWQGPIHDIAVEDCVIRTAEDISGWTVEDWNALPCDGIDADGARIVLRGNRIENVRHGISANGPHALVRGNAIANFSGDGIRGLGDHSVYQNNVVKNCYKVNDHHDDGFQSWSVGPGGVGTGEVAGVVLRGNRIVNFEDPEQPFRGTLQGVGCFDGMFVDWVIEDNTVIVDHYHGITLLGARGCRITGNTVVDPDPERPGPAWIRIGKHKNGKPSTDCAVTGNRAPALAIEPGQDVTARENRIGGSQGAP
jgi:hypothetical protein